ncbi:MAG: response regulator [Candidatus Acidiferrales bacterium]
MPPLLRVLMVEDSEDDAAMLVRAIRQGGYDVEHRRVDTAAALAKSLDTETWNLVISDHSMPGFSGTAALAILRKKGLDIPFIFVSGTIGEDVAVDAMKVGAQDYIMKGNLTRLLPAIERELREAENRRKHKQVEQRLRQLEKFEALGKLAGGIAHDFNNAIGAIMGWAELGREEGDARKNSEKYFQKIFDQSIRAAGLARQLLAYARRQVLERRNLNLNEAVNETMALLQKVIGEQIEIKMSLASDLRVTRADPVQMEQVLMNLCLNARDAMPKGGQLFIETRNVELDENYCERHNYVRPGPFVLLSVVDSGVGMDERTMEHIFEPFFTTKEEGKGTGLGLATALGIVKQHEGSLEVYSEIGKGTVFHVFLPASDGASQLGPPVDETPVRGGSETILVADDHEGVREMVRGVLNALGYRVLLACDGDEALGNFEANRDAISLVLLDVVMPKLGGAEVYDKICEFRPGTPVIFTSGYPEEGAMLAKMAAAGAVMLQKPYQPKILARKIRQVLDQKVKQN